jgi:vacuolar iron transporter family protein
VDPPKNQSSEHRHRDVHRGTARAAIFGVSDGLTTNVSLVHLGSPVGAALSSLVAFAIGAGIPLIPWYFMHGTAAVVTSVTLAAIAALVVGAALGFATGRSRVRSALRQVTLTGIAAGVVFLVGRLVGVTA